MDLRDAAAGIRMDEPSSRRARPPWPLLAARATVGRRPRGPFVMKCPDPLRFLARSVVLVASALPCAAQTTNVLDFDVPELAVTRWLNVEAGAKPTLAALRGKPVLIEFWATSVKHCGKTFPHAQALHDRYGDLGLEVLAVSYDTVPVLEKLIDQRGYSVPIGVDPSLAVYQDFLVHEVPLALLIDPEGRMVYHGQPEAVDLAIEVLLGIEASTESLFESCLAGRQGEAAERGTIERLIAKAPRAFDLAEWARAQAGELPADFAPDAALEDPSAALAAYARASRARDDDAANALLFTLAAGLAPPDFDLKRWAWGELARAYPLELAELEEQLAANRYELVFESMLHREPSAELRQRAAADAGFTEHCGRVLLEARTLARQGLLAQHWVFPGVEPRSRQRLWSDLGVGGVAEDDDGRPSLSIGVERVDAAGIAAFVDEQLLRYLLARGYASRGAPDADALRARLPKERADMLRELQMRHGK